MRKLSIALISLLLLTQGGLQAGVFPTADRVVVEKGDRKLHLVRNG